ncbi:MAG: SMP-30/gluconolactonase/LRE family protein, partial [Chloroflexi bacterium]|nr:SMP-30/gluconolactonase/LRE family protein [Chloroflexota bacterium]
MFQQKVTENRSTMRYWPAVSDRLGEQVSRRPWEYVMDAINTPKLPFKPQYIGGALVVVIAVLLLVLLFNTDDGAGAESVPADSPQQIVPESGSGEPVGDTFDPDAEAEGATLVAKWGSPGGGDGQFNRPGGVAVDASGNVYVADFDNHRVQVFSPEGRFLRKWGSEGAADGEFDGPTGVAVDGSGNVYVVDGLNARVQVFSPEGRFLRKWGSEGAADGEFGGPTGVAVDASGNVYVVDTGSHRVQVFSPEGR